MLKFHTVGVKSEASHYRDCAAQRMPYVEVKHGRRYSRISFDVYEMVKPAGLPGEQPCEFIADLYQTYARFFSLPANKVSCVGGSNNLIFTVYREHAGCFAAQLHDYLAKFITSELKKCA